MKILYGVQGTGNGHIARARAMSAALKQRGAEVDYLFSGRKVSDYFAMEEFGDYQTRQGLTFVTSHGGVNYWQTARVNQPWRLWQEINTLDLSQYDLVLNDFEPISAWAAKRQGKTSISISHQNAFRHNVPLKGASWFDRQVIHHFAPATYHIGLHWYHFEQPILPPIISPQVTGQTQEGFILVYLPFEDRAEIQSLLDGFQQQRFVCYHPNVNEMEHRGHIEFRPLSREGFCQSLGACLGVIANGGFELPSEALQLGKKILLKPLRGQFEQQSNAATLEALGLASCMEYLDAGTVRNWLSEPAAEPVQYPDVASAISDWILKGAWHDQGDLVTELWSQVQFPNYVANLPVNINGKTEHALIDW